MSVARLLRTPATVYRKTEAVSTTSGSIGVTWTEVGEIRCTIQGLSSRDAFVAGASRLENQYTMFTDIAVDVRPHDRLEIKTYRRGLPVQGIAGPASSTVQTYMVEGGPEDEAGRGRLLKYSVKRVSTTSPNE